MNNNKSEKTTGLYKLITFPKFYSAFQNILGAQKARERFISEWLCLKEDQSVLDVGCGPGTLTPHLNYKSYIGIDMNLDHIKAAQSKFGNAKTKFHSGRAQDLVHNIDAKFDRIICSGFLHHLSDEDAKSLIDCLITKLNPQGYIVLLEPTFITNQRFFARWMKKIDSGQHIRTHEHWLRLFSKYSIECKITNDLARVPYDHIWLKLRQKI